MLIIRPTASLAKRMGQKLQPTDLHSTTVLGDWYANDIVLDRKQFIICVSSRSRLAVVIDAAPYATFPLRLAGAASEVMRVIGVGEAKIQQELIQMQELLLAKTINKSILGSLNEYKFQLEAFNQMGKMNLKNTFEMSLYLCRTISLVIPEGYPKDAALGLFGLPPKPMKPLHALDAQKPRLFIVK
jgi:hypothetical protein